MSTIGRCWHRNRPAMPACDVPGQRAWIVPSEHLALAKHLTTKCDTDQPVTSKATNGNRLVPSPPQPTMSDLAKSEFHGLTIDTIRLLAVRIVA